MWQSYNGLTTHARWGEWEKWALKSTKPSMGLRYLVDTGWIELSGVANLLESSKIVWHPEGDA